MIDSRPRRKSCRCVGCKNKCDANELCDPLAVFIIDDKTEKRYRVIKKFQSKVLNALKRKRELDLRELEHKRPP